ncbi:MAG: exopolyphosphatase [Burkholderiaceae bacterium]|nr:exopolyphosphatase [Burkholderiaceae bacterium]
MKNDTLLAAIDLGSNSFRLEIGRLSLGQIHRVEYLKETVRQGNGLDSERLLSDEAMQRGWDCLARFAERLSGFKKQQVRAVATQTLREARNREDFLSRAKQILGFPIEVISGREEARLIYQGVAHLLPQTEDRRLVIDIGGRSTELIVGQGLEASVTESYRVGSVAWSMKYFRHGQLDESAFDRAEIAAKAILDEALSLCPRNAWDVAYGSSGTVGAVGDILSVAGWSQGIIDREGLAWLKRCMLRAQHVDKLRLEGLKEDRRAVIGGGVSVLMALFDLLDIDVLHVADGALRHGVLFDMLEREDEHEDIRATTVRRLQKNFGVDLTQADRVRRVALELLTQLSPDVPEHEPTRIRRKLEWAAQLHEMGALISHSDYHKHGAYILDNSDATGFAVSELHRLSLLVLGHRGKLRKLNVDFDDDAFAMQLMCLRLSVILCHARRDPESQPLKLSCSGTPDRQFKLELPADWAKQYPQSTHLLNEEVQAWQKTTWNLVLQVD